MYPTTVGLFAGRSFSGSYQHPHMDQAGFAPGYGPQGGAQGGMMPGMAGAQAGAGYMGSQQQFANQR